MTQILLTPDPDELTRARHGLLMHELVNSSSAGNLPDAAFSMSYLRLPPGEVTQFHNHHLATVVVVLLTAGPEGAGTDVVHDTAAGAERTARRYVQHPGQALVLPPGVPHRAVNLSATEEVTGFEVRVTSDSVFADNNLLPYLNGTSVELVDNPVMPWPAGAAHA